MANKTEVRLERKPRQTVRRSAEHKALLSEGSKLLALRMSEKRNSWDLK